VTHIQKTERRDGFLMLQNNFISFFQH
jgi:hypothetical protein